MFFNLDFQEPLKMTKRLRNRNQRSDPAGPCLGTLFVTFSEKVQFFLEGLVKVEHLVLARVRSDFGAILPGG